MSLALMTVKCQYDWFLNDDIGSCASRRREIITIHPPVVDTATQEYPLSWFLPHTVVQYCDRKEFGTRVKTRERNE